MRSKTEGPPTGGIWNLKMTRGSFIGLSVIAAVGPYALETPHKKTVQKEIDKDFYPGWIEADIQSPFIQKEKGHFYWLREAVLVNPALTTLTKDYFSYLEKNRKAGTRLSLGTAVAFSMDNAQKLLGDAAKSRIDPRTNVSLESIHLGAIAFAAGFMPWFDESDLARIGVKIDSDKSAVDYFESKDGLQTVTYPKLFATGEERLNTDNPEGGQDRAAHFAQHLLLTFEYLYSGKYHLAEHDTMPNFLRAYLYL